jgi:xylulokinase
MWGTVGAFAGTFNLAGGMAASGAITTWIRDLAGAASYAELTLEASKSPAGANGLLMLPYFAGERTPISDPHARGAILGLTLSHTRGDLYRAALEATAMGVRHNLEAVESSGGDVRRIVAIGGGTQGGLWTQIVSNVTGRDQEVPVKTVGAAFGGAYLAARLIAEPDIQLWNPRATVVSPDPATSDRYTALYELYRELYPATRTISHALAAVQAL